MLLTVIHPYSYMIKGKEYGPGVGDSGKFDMLNSLVSAADASNLSILVQRMNAPDCMSNGLRDAAVSLESRLAFTKNYPEVCTTNYGVPLLDRPVEKQDDAYRALQEFYSTESEVLAHYEPHSIILFVGGMLAACVSGATEFAQKQCDATIYLVEEACAVYYDQEFQDKMRAQRESLGIIPLGYDDALQLISQQHPQ